MNHNEFDNYLALVSRLLKLDRKQQNQLTDELRDHLEARIHELVDEGQSLEDAKRLAVEDFGDAAALAKEMNDIARAKRRLWTMRFTTIATAASFLVILFVFSIWPDDAKVGGPNKSDAVEAVKDKTFGFASRETGRDELDKHPVAPEIETSTTAQKNLTIRQNLKRNQNINLNEIPLEEALDAILENSGVAYHLDWATCNPGTASKLVSFQSSNIELRTALRIMLDQLDLAYTIQQGCLIIIPKEKMADHGFLERRIINVAPLLGWLRLEHPDSAKQQLEELIRTSVRPDSWDSTNGVSTIRIIGDLLIANADSAACDEIESFLLELSAAIPNLAANPIESSAD